MRVGFIGLGNMGRPMALNLLRAGFPLVVYNRTRSRAEDLRAQGAEVADSPARLTEQVDIVLACLADVPAVESVFRGREGVLEAARPGQVLVDHSTVGPATSRSLSQAARRRGASFLDAPISGGPEGAAAGTLTIMVGGEEEAFQRALPVFQAMGRTILHMGPSGAGSVTKLVNQLLVGVHTLASCEALLLGTRAGVDPEKMLQVLRNSWGTSRMLERNAPYILGRRFQGTGAPLRLIVKDLSLILEMGRDLGVPLPASATAHRLFHRAREEGLSEADITALLLLLEREEGPP